MRARRSPNGWILFNQINRIILGAGGTLIIHPPIGDAIGPLQSPVLTVDSGTQTIVLSFAGPVIGPDYVLQVWTTQPLVPANSYNNIGEKFTANFTTPTSPIDFTAEWQKVHGGWQFATGCIVYAMPYIVNIYSGDISGQVILKAVST